MSSHPLTVLFAKMTLAQFAMSSMAASSASSVVTVDWGAGGSKSVKVSSKLGAPEKVMFPANSSPLNVLGPDVNFCLVSTTSSATTTGLAADPVMITGSPSGRSNSGMRNQPVICTASVSSVNECHSPTPTGELSSPDLGNTT